jgi:hypothetical protein
VNKVADTVLSFAALFSKGYAIMLYWKWLLSPYFGISAINIWMAIALVYMHTVLCFDPSVAREKADNQSVINSSSTVILSFLIIFIGWLLSDYALVRK